jgi:predicted Zn-dependent protease
MRWALATVGAFALGLAGCAYNPELGRDQLILVDQGQLTQLAEASWRSTLARERVSRDPEANARVTRVAQRIVQAAGRGGERWEYVVFDNPSANAFVLPGNRVGVNTGLLKIARTDGELAAVLGHEIAHVTARHAAERYSQSSLAQVGQAAASVAAGQSDSRYAGQIAGLFGTGLQYGVLNPYSRRHELEADRIGLDYMARAGYRPSEAVTLWRNMAAQTGRGTPSILSTHPSDAQRIQAIEAHIAANRYA